MFNVCIFYVPGTSTPKNVFGNTQSHDHRHPEPITRGTKMTFENCLQITAPRQPSFPFNLNLLLLIITWLIVIVLMYHITRPRLTVKINPSLTEDSKSDMKRRSITKTNYIITITVSY